MNCHDCDRPFRHKAMLLGSICITCQRNALLKELRECALAFDALIEDRPMLAAKLCGTTTLGGRRAEAQALIHRLTEVELS